MSYEVAKCSCGGGCGDGGDKVEWVTRQVSKMSLECSRCSVKKKEIIAELFLYSQHFLHLTIPGFVKDKAGINTVSR